MSVAAWLSIWTLAERELVRFYRQRARVIGAVAPPLVFWTLIGSGLGASFRAAPTDNAGAGGLTALQYLFPGTVMLTVLFTSIFSTISLIEDRREGFLQSVLVAPIPRASLVLGKLLGGATLACAQGALFLLCAPFIGASLTWASGLAVLGLLWLAAFGLAGLGFAFAWQLDSVQGFHAVMNLVLMPMWLLSGALFPSAGAPVWLRWAMRLNPLTYGVDALRRGCFPSQADGASLPVCLLVTLLFGLCTSAVSFRVAGQRTARTLG